MRRGTPLPQQNTALADDCRLITQNLHINAAETINGINCDTYTQLTESHAIEGHHPETKVQLFCHCRFHTPSVLFFNATFSHNRNNTEATWHLANARRIVSAIGKRGRESGWKLAQTEIKQTCAHAGESPSANSAKNKRRGSNDTQGKGKIKHFTPSALITKG